MGLTQFVNSNESVILMNHYQVFSDSHGNNGVPPKDFYKAVLLRNASERLTVNSLRLLKPSDKLFTNELTESVQLMNYPYDSLTEPQVPCQCIITALKKKVNKKEKQTNVSPYISFTKPLVGLTMVKEFENPRFGKERK